MITFVEDKNAHLRGCISCRANKQEDDNRTILFKKEYLTHGKEIVLCKKCRSELKKLLEQEE